MRQLAIKPHPAFFRKAFSLALKSLVRSTHRANFPKNESGGLHHCVSAEAVGYFAGKKGQRFL
jgi:hypothetical protein